MNAGSEPIQTKPDPVVAALRSSLQLPDDVPLEDATELSAVPGWDSFGHVRLVMELEALLDRRLDMDEIVALTSIADIRALLNGNPAKSG